MGAQGLRTLDPLIKSKLLWYWPNVGGPTVLAHLTLILPLGRSVARASGTRKVELAALDPASRFGPGVSLKALTPGGGGMR